MVSVSLTHNVIKINGFHSQSSHLRIDWGLMDLIELVSVELSDPEFLFPLVSLDKLIAHKTKVSLLSQLFLLHLGLASEYNSLVIHAALEVTRGTCYPHLGHPVLYVVDLEPYFLCHLLLAGIELLLLLVFLFLCILLRLEDDRTNLHQFILEKMLRREF